IGTIIKFILNYTLIAIPGLNIDGMIISNFVSFGVIALLNYRILKKITGYRVNIWQTIIKPLLSSLIMAVFLMLLGNIVFAYFSNSIAIILIVLGAVPFYTIALFLTNTIKQEDLDMIPGGEKLKKYYRKG
ncbi:polysaccharide biosynthesis C-terminal domain-containing protein, partial [Alkalibaculum bacchi]|uniref:polysaccharide biosynthesis C-terminal domain-containing protein n=1 Tax=Alkalibaculum bacchi TaxID=645887 RepID=UPI0026EAFBEE